MELNQIYNEDCLEFMKGFPSNSIDLIISDPPYNVSRENNFQTMGTANRIGMDFGEWDKGFNQEEWIGYLPRILKENANVVVFNDWKNLTNIQNALAKNNITPKRCLVLNKSNPAPFNRDRMFVNDVEFAVWGVYNSKNKPTRWTFNRSNPVEKCVIDTTVQSSKLHPTMKDLKVIKYLVGLLSNEGDLVFDPFMGSGTTAVACRELNRNYIGTEIDERYYNVTLDRLKEAENSQPLEPKQETNG